MKKIPLLLCLLLGLSGLISLAGCGGDNKLAADFEFLQGERISQADMDFFWDELVYMLGGNNERNDYGEQLCLSSLVITRTMIWEAEAQGVGLSREEALELAKAHYAEAEAAAQAGQPTGEETYQQPEYWDWLQEHMQAVNMTPENWWAYNATLLQVDAATEALQEQFYADLSPEQLEDTLARNNAQLAYQYGLAVKYRDQLVEEDLESLLDEVLAIMESAVSKAN